MWYVCHRLIFPYSESFWFWLQITNLDDRFDQKNLKREVILVGSHELACWPFFLFLVQFKLINWTWHWYVLICAKLKIITKLRLILWWTRWNNKKTHFAILHSQKLMSTHWNLQIKRIPSNRSKKVLTSCMYCIAKLSYLGVFLYM